MISNAVALQRSSVAQAAAVHFLARSLSGSVAPWTLSRRCISIWTSASARRMQRLEADANTRPQNAEAQAAYYRELNNASDPAAVVRRYESQRYASNDAALREYVSALAKTVGKLPTTTQGKLSSGLNDADDNASQTQKIRSTVHNLIQGRRDEIASSERITSDAPSSRVRTGNTDSINQYNVHKSNKSCKGDSNADTYRGASSFFFNNHGQTANATMQIPQSALSSENSSSSSSGKSEPMPVQITINKTQNSLIRYTLMILAAAYALTFFSDIGKEQSFEVKNSTVSTTSFSDVHGVDEVKHDLEEIVLFLKDPAQFTRLGGKLPKGVLLTGPPGTGKTLLARAVAGEADVPFFYASGSEFDEVYVGVGAKRVRELFAEAKKKAPSIVFIDEIDTIGSKRNPKDQMFAKMTLNQLLIELDGFKPSDNVVVIGATNFPESLDKALIRPGRFDHRIEVMLPDIRGRTSILKHHTKTMPIGEDVKMDVLARGTPGFSGAELANLANLAALHASREGKSKVTMSDFEFAKDKILMGAERKSHVMSDEDKRLVAYHEGGHALVGLKTPGAMPIHKATIMPRGSALGMVSMLPESDREGWTRKQLLARMDVAMGGRVAEEMMFGEENVTSGAGSDLQQATRIAHSMVTKFGMSKKLGPVVIGDDDRTKYSASTLAEVESEEKVLLEGAKERARKILTTYQRELHMLAKGLMEYETLTREEIEDLLQGKPIRQGLKAANASAAAAAATA